MSKLQEMMAARKAQAAIESAEIEQLQSAASATYRQFREVEDAEAQVLATVPPVPVMVVAPELANFQPKAQAPVHPLTMRMAELAEALTANIPNFPTILQDIHKHLRLDPAIVTLMTEDEIRLVVSGLEKHAQVTVVAPKAVKDAKKLGKLNITADLL